jgi:hypothetical protein
MGLGMSEPQGLGSLTSKKGWVRIGYDQKIWIPCLAIFPEGYDRESYSAEFARLWWAMSGLDHSPVDVERLSHMLAAIHEGIYGQIPCHLAFVHLPDPRLMPLVLYVGVWESDGDQEEQLRMLCLAGDTEAVEPPMVDEYATDSLGTGLRVMRYRHLDDGSLYAGLSYAWRSEEYETDLLLFASAEDLGRLQRAIPDIEEFARVTSIISQAELHE